MHGWSGVDRHLSTLGSLLDTTFPLVFESFVERLLSARLLILQVTILLLEAASFLLSSKYLLDEGPLPLLVLDAAAVELSRTFLDGANLTVFWRLHLAALLSVVTMWVKDITHLEELQVSFELGSEVGLGQVEPLRASCCFLFL